MKICRHENFQQIDTKYQNPSTEALQWQEKFEVYRECSDCGVWKGKRHDSHCYDKDYYQRCNIIENGIPQRSWYFEIHANVWKEMKIPLDPKRVLELGCSIGRLLWTFHRMAGSECVGIENSIWACDWQRETYGFIPGQYEVFREDCEKVDLEGFEKFNLIYACHVLEHMKDPMALIERCCKSLEKDGHLYLVVPDKEHQLTLHIHDWAFDEEGLKLWFKQAGLKKIKVVKTNPHNPPPAPHTDFKGYYLHISGQK